MAASPPHWTELLLPEELRRRACTVLRHVAVDPGPCVAADADLLAQALDRIEALEHELAELMHYNAATEGAARALHEHRAHHHP